MRVTPQKARLVLNLIRGRRVEEARNTLAFTKKRVAATIGKLLQSAIDNANFLSTEKGLDVDVDNLYVKHVAANDGPRMKRVRPAPMGRAYRYVRRREQGGGSGEAESQGQSEGARKKEGSCEESDSQKVRLERKVCNQATGHKLAAKS
jgi:large subunit ribosomal protein L22